jgi:hypothetical protein
MNAFVYLLVTILITTKVRDVTSTFTELGMPQRKQTPLLNI